MCLGNRIQQEINQWILEWRHIERDGVSNHRRPGAWVTKKNSMLKSMLDYKDFEIWHLIGWQHTRHQKPC